MRNGVSKLFRAIPEQRQESKINISQHDALMSGFACMHFQAPSLLQFQKQLEDDQNQNNLRTLFGVQDIPKETQMRSIIDQIDSEYFRPIFKDVYSRLQRGKHLEKYQILEGKYYFPIDGSQFFSSKEVNCEGCLVKNHKKESPTYSHQILQGGIAHPDCSEVIPFMPEHIVNEDGDTKQDCEINAAKRYLKKIRAGFPQLGLMIGGDGLYSNQPMIEAALEERMSYVFVC